MPTRNEGHPPEPTSAAYDAWASWMGRERRGEAEPLGELFREHAAIADELRVLASDGRAYDLIEEEVEPGPMDIPTPARPGMIHADVWMGDSAAALREQLIAQRRGAPRYSYGKEIGRGGMGAVYEGEDLVLHRQVAIKRVHPALLRHWSGQGATSLAGFVERFLREAQSLARLDHPGIVPIHDLDIDEHGDVFFVMPRIAGETLARILARPKGSGGAWSLTRKMDSIRRVAEIVSFAHGKGTLHRDLKPDNVMVDVGDALYVLDWGLAVSSNDPTEGESTSGRPVVATASSQIGAPWYTAPEVLEGESPTEQADIYSLGAMLFEVIHGQRPYGAITDRAAAVAAVTGRQIPPGSTTAGKSAFPELDAIAHRAMSSDPSGRHLSCEEFAAELRAFEEGRVVGSYEQGALAELRKWVGRNRGVAFASAAALTLAIGTLVALLAFKNAAADRDIAEVKSEREKMQREYEQLAGERRLLAQVSAEAARVAFRQGEWSDALSSIETARTEGFAQPALLDLWTSDALSNLERHEEAIGVLLAMDDADLTASERGGRDVRLALAGWQDATMDTAERERRVRSALEADLPEAELGLARAFLSTRVEAAVEHLRSAIAADRFHSTARRHLMQLLQITGRNQELRAELNEYRILFPSDSFGFFIQAHLATVDGDADGFEESLKQLKKRLPSAGYEAVAFALELIRQVQRTLTCDAVLGHISAIQAAKLGMMIFKAERTAMTTLGTGVQAGFTSTIPCAGRYYRALPSLLSAGVKQLRGKGESSGAFMAMVDEELKHMSDGSLYYFRAIALLDQFPFQGTAEEKAEAKRSLLTPLDESTMHPSVMPAFVHAAKVEAITMRFKLDPHRSESDWAEFQADIDWFLGHPNLDNFESQRVIFVCLETKDIENARRAMAVRLRTHAPDGWSHTQLARCDLAEGRYHSALRELEAAATFEDNAAQREKVKAEVLANLDQ